MNNLDNNHLENDQENDNNEDGEKEIDLNEVDPIDRLFLEYNILLEEEEI